jgi:murein DD-endopeptidase MepM/ murein hydrolase activator NlpD
MGLRNMSVNSFFQGIDLIPEMPDISHISFENIIDLPDNVYVHDFESNNKFQDTSDSFSIGRYNEKRPNMYEGDLFEKTNRFIHMGIDIGAPVGTPVKSFYDGEIFLFKYNDQKLDYGYTIITKHQIKGQNIYALYGHLSNSSLKDKKIGQKIYSGEVIAHLGSEEENGGWPSHVHFQLSLIEPKICDLPGVVSESDHNVAVKVFPDPRIVLGNIY